MTGKHPRSKHPGDAGLRGDPGIGTSPGRGRDDDLLDGENSFEGAVMNDTEADGRIDPRRRGRTNQ